VSSALLEVRKLRTWFRVRDGEMRAVDGVDLSVDQGRTLCLVGESGCGKSVTALSIMRLVDPPGRIMPGSEIRFRGLDLVSANEERLRRLRGNQLSMIFQEPMTSLNPVFTVGNQITEAIRLHRAVSAKEARARAIEMMRLVGIPSPERRFGDHPHQLSGGMRQRTMIAMALACDPKLLIADEPTTALDVTIQAQILQLMRDLQARLGMAIMMITHDLGVVAEMADDVAVMYAGRVVERGSAKNVFRRPQHPYTEALLHSMPRLGLTQETPLQVIPGMVPSPLRWPRGCRFADRCAHVFERCREADPPLAKAGPQEAACWLCEAGPRPSEGVQALG
jgi:oligopeptide/dipeptide ABC transporter ATP-binding protein